MYKQTNIKQNEYVLFKFVGTDSSQTSDVPSSEHISIIRRKHYWRIQ